MKKKSKDAYVKNPKMHMLQNMQSSHLLLNTQTYTILTST